MDSKKTKIILSTLIIVALISVFGAVGYKLLNSNNSNQSQTSNTSNKDQTSSTETSAGAPANFSKDAGILLSKDGINKPISGIPTIEIYAAPICPFCGGVERASGETLEKMAKDGKINLVSHPLALEWMNRFTPGDNYSARAAAALVYVGANAPEHYFDFNSYIFRSDIQPQEGSEYTKVSNEQIAAWAKDAGVPENVAKNCANGEYLKWISNWSDNAGIQSTPIVKVDGAKIKYNVILGDAQISSDLRTVSKTASEESIQKILDNTTTYLDKE